MKNAKKIIAFALSIVMFSSCFCISVSAEEARASSQNSVADARALRMVHTDSGPIAPGGTFVINNPSGNPDYYLHIAAYRMINIDMDVSEDTTFKVGIFNPVWGQIQWSSIDFSSYNRQISVGSGLDEGRHLIFIQNTSNKTIYFFNIRSDY